MGPYATMTVYLGDAGEPLTIRHRVHDVHGERPSAHLDFTDNAGIWTEDPAHLRALAEALSSAADRLTEALAKREGKRGGRSLSTETP